MNISSDTGGIDSSAFLDYIAKQFPSDLAQMVALRDELAKRQGAISAVDDANKKLADADVYAQNIKAQADALLATAKTASADSQDKQALLDAREKDLTALENQAVADSAATAKDVAAKEASLTVREDGLAQAQAELIAGQAKTRFRSKRA